MKKRLMKRTLAAGLVTAMAFTSLSAVPASAAAETQEREITTNYTNPEDWTRRHSLDEINDMMYDLADKYPEYTKLGSLGQTGNGRQMTLLTITDESVPNDNKKEIGIWGNIHGGERESGESTAYTTAWFLENLNDPTVKSILKNHVLYCVPILNQDGYYYSDWYYVRGTSRPIDKNGDGIASNDWFEDITGDKWIGYIYASSGEAERPKDSYIGNVGYESPDHDGNGWLGDDEWYSGVDSNRNFDYTWAKDHASNGGPWAASEIETQNMQRFLDNHPNMAALATLHTGIQCVLYPWCHRDVDTSNPAEVADIKFMAETAENMRKAIETTTQRNFYAKSSYHDYPTYSELTDYAYGKHGIHTYTIEVYSSGIGENTAYDPNHDPADDSVCAWNEENYPQSKNEYYPYDEFVEILKGVGLSPETVKVEVRADKSETTIAEMKPEGFYVSSSSYSNARCHWVPEDQDMMVAGAKDALLQMIYSEGLVVDPATVDKSKLESLIEEAEEAEEVQFIFTEKSYEPFAKALETARKVMEEAVYTQEEIDKAAADLKDAMDKLVELMDGAKWVKDSKGWWFRFGDGTWPADCRMLIDNKVYAFKADGYMATGWAKIEGDWSYHKNSGEAVTGWGKISGKWYYFDEQGFMLSGWQQVNGKWYYLGSANDGAMKSGWQKISGKWYYLGAANDGAMKSGWQKVSGKWYYLGGANDGAMKSGWQQINGKWYYLGGANDGAMKSGWQKINGKWYYLGTANDGAMKSGWQKVGGRWYYLGAAEDGAMKSGWQQINGSWYYLGGPDDGKMRYGTHVIDGKTYYFGGPEDGRMR